MSDAIAELNEIFQETFQDHELQIRSDMTAADVDGWDSLMHVSLMLNIESRLGLRFTSTEVATLKTVGELIDLVRNKKGA